MFLALQILLLLLFDVPYICSYEQINGGPQRSSQIFKENQHNNVNASIGWNVHRPNFTTSTFCYLQYFLGLGNDRILLDFFQWNIKYFHYHLENYRYHCAACLLHATLPINKWFAWVHRLHTFLLWIVWILLSTYLISVWIDQVKSCHELEWWHRNWNEAMLGEKVGLWSSWW